MKTTTIKILCAAFGLAVGLTGSLYLLTVHSSAALGTPTVAASGKQLVAEPDVIDAVYPLYSAGILWSPKVSVTLPPRSNYNPTNKIIAGYQIVSYPTASTEDIGGIIGPFRHSYDQMLLKKGWNINTLYEADGAGGSLWGFTKGKNILILSYTSTFMYQEPNMPSHCPCTIVFTIIGGTLK